MGLSFTQKVMLKIGKVQAQIAERDYTVEEIKRVIRSTPEKVPEARNWIFKGVNRFCPAKFEFKVFRNAAESSMVNGLKDLESTLFAQDRFFPDELGIEHYEQVPENENGSRTKYTYLTEELLDNDLIKAFSSVAHSCLRERIANASQGVTQVKGRFGCSLVELFDRTTDSEKPMRGFFTYSLPEEMYGIATHADSFAVWGVAVLLLRDGGSIANGLHVDTAEGERVDLKQEVGDVAVIDCTTPHSVPITRRSERRTSLIVWF